MTHKKKIKKRDFERSRSEILKVAFLEIFINGFQGVSVDDIVNKTNLTKGAFYHHFPTKLDLGYANIDETIKNLTLNRWVYPLEKYENAVDGILFQLNKIIKETPTPRLILGCPLNNLIQEMANVDLVFRKKLKSVIELWISEIDKKIQKSQEKGFIKKDLNSRNIAEFIVMTHEGIFGMLKGTGDKKIYYSLFESFEVYMNLIRGKKKKNFIISYSVKNKIDHSGTRILYRF